MFCVMFLTMVVSNNKFTLVFCFVLVLCVYSTTFQVLLVLIEEEKEKEVEEHGAENKLLLLPVQKKAL